MVWGQLTQRWHRDLPSVVPREQQVLLTLGMKSSVLHPPLDILESSVECRGHSSVHHHPLLGILESGVACSIKEQ